MNPTARRAFWRMSTQFDRARVDVWMGIRNTAGIVLPLVAGVWAARVSSGLVAATGALNVAAADGVDSYRTRGVRMLASSLIGAVAVFAGGLSGEVHGAVIAGRALWAFAAGLAVCLGQSAADIGMISLVVFIIYSAQSMTPDQAFWSGCIALGGGLLQTALSVSLWAWRGFLPERRLIGELYRELARSATVRPDPFAAPPVSRSSTQAHEALAAIAGDHRIEVERLYMLVSQAERVRLALFALNRWQVRLRRDGGDALAGTIDRFLDPASKVLDAVGRCLYDEPVREALPERLEDVKAAAAAFRGAADQPASPALQPLLAEARQQVDTLSGAIRAVVELAENTTHAGEFKFAARERQTPWYLQLGSAAAVLRSNLSLDSSACRHAIRLAVCVLIGDLLAGALALPRSYWLAMTIALVLKPDFGSTFSRGALRLAGTYVGLVLATLLVHVFPLGAYTEIVWIAILSFLVRSFGRANYGVLSAAVGALVVFLFAMLGIAPKDVIAARALNTSIGGAMAMAVYWVWPTRERNQAPSAIATMLDDYRLYFRAVSRLFAGGPPVDERELERFRTNARRSRSNVETSVDRLAAEPYVHEGEVSSVNAMLASSHRFIHAVMAVEAGQESGSCATASAAFGVFGRDVEKMLYYLAARLRGSNVPIDGLPDLREDHNRLVGAGDNGLLAIESDRMTNSLNTLAEQVFRWAGTPDAAR
jgi:uncharacterized membrane protein YccC